MSGFDLFVGIDWSGAKGAWQPGLRIATARPGVAAPVLVDGPGPNGRWSRDAACRSIAEIVGRERALIGIDFAFGFPPLPCPRMSWREVDRHCSVDDGLYGGRFFSGREHSYGSYVNGPWGKGEDYSARYHRTTERQAALTRGAYPSTVLNGVGSAAVGFSSISGMRALVRLRDELGPKLVIWPFDPLDDEASVLVEIFPRFFPLLKGRKPAMRVVENLNAALAAYGSEAFSAPIASEDAGDAVISAAALRALSAESTPWASLPPEARHEGWIFGVPPA